VAATNLRHAAERSAVTVALSTARDRAFVTFDGVNRVLEPRLQHAITRLRRLPRHVHFALGPRRCGRWASIVNRLRTRGVTTSWDFGWHEHLRDDPQFGRLLGTLDWVFVNEREAAWYVTTRTLPFTLRRWRERARGVVVKRGARGALALTSAGEFRAPAFRVTPLDTTGAGDAFDAGFLTALLAGAAVHDALRVGNYVGAQSTRAAGGVDGLPARTRLPRWARRILEAA
jgi:sugar/nucleoside kinase (ribokinase family)